MESNNIEQALSQYLALVSEYDRLNSLAWDCASQQRQEELIVAQEAVNKCLEELVLLYDLLEELGHVF